MNPALVQMMLDRGDFAGSYFVELQMYGEPLCSPYFDQIVDMLYGHRFKLGMSTNGMLMNDIKTIDLLDYVTVSIDSPVKERYETRRPGASFNRLIHTINTRILGPKLDLQVIKFHDHPSELPELIELARRMEWDDVTCREVPDCFASYQGRPYPEEQRHQLCLNPWLSVSVQWDGDVVPCCFAAGKDIVYGNLYEQDLKTIWCESKTRQVLMATMRDNFNQNSMPCRLCYMRSPVLFHLRMFMEEIR